MEDSGPLPVEIISPWTSSERISQQATSLKSLLVARVGTANEGCQAGQEMLLLASMTWQLLQVPDSAVFAWVVAAEADLGKLNRKRFRNGKRIKSHSWRWHVMAQQN